MSETSKLLDATDYGSSSSINGGHGDRQETDTASSTKYALPHGPAHPPRPRPQLTPRAACLRDPLAWPQ